MFRTLKLGTLLLCIASPLRAQMASPVFLPPFADSVATYRFAPHDLPPPENLIGSAPIPSARSTPSLFPADWEEHHAVAGGNRLSFYGTGRASRAVGTVAVEVDAEGNTYVAGFADGEPYRLDLILAKYDQSGTELWRSQALDTVGASDFPRDLSLGAGMACVVGRRHYVGFFVMCFSPEGQELWRDVHESETSSGDAIAVGDDALFVVGRMNDKLAVSRYSHGGEREWVTYLTNESEVGVGIAIEIGPDGALYVGGGRAGEDGWQDFFTAKLTPEGETLWTADYGGSGADVLVALEPATDGVYVAGRVSVTNDFTPDYALVKYDEGGTEAWTALYGEADRDDLATALAVGPNAVVVTGESQNGGTFDFSTVAYSHGGTPLWTREAQGWGGGDDVATGVAFMPDGGVVVTGLSWSGSAAGYDVLTIAYTASGQEVARHTRAGPSSSRDIPYDIAVTNDGTVRVVGYGLFYVARTGAYYAFTDAQIAAYSADMVPLWEQRLDGVGFSRDFAGDISIGPSVVMGTNSFSPFSSFDPALRGLNADGTTSWVTLDPSETYASNYVVDVGFDAQGRMHTVESRSYACGTNSNLVISRRDPNTGELLSSLCHDADVLSSLLDPSGSTYALGRPPSIENHVYLYRFTPEGVLDWERLSSPGTVALDLVSDGEGGVYHARSLGGTGGYVLERYAPDGTVLRSDTLRDPAAAYHLPLSLAKAGTGVVLAGWTDEGILISHLPHNGASPVTTTFAPPSGNAVERVSHLVADNVGNAWFVLEEDATPLSLYSLVHVDLTGGMVVEITDFVPASESWYYTDALMPTGDGGLIVFGVDTNFDPYEPGLPALLVEWLDAEHTLRDAVVAPLPFFANLRFADVEIGPDGRGYAAWTASRGWFDPFVGDGHIKNWSGVALLQFSDPVTVASDPDGFSEQDRVWSYPNPAVDRATVAFALRRSGPVRLELFDVLGRRMAVLADGEWEAGKHEIGFASDRMPAGIYFFRLRTGSGVSTKRMTLVQ